MVPEWHTLSDTHHALTQVQLHPAGGLTFRHLTAEHGTGWLQSLTIDEGEALRQILGLASPGAPPPPPVFQDNPSMQRAINEALKKIPVTEEDVAREEARQAQGNHAALALLDAWKAIPTVLQHCLDADRAETGLIDEQEVRQHLIAARIPADGLYGDWGTELARHFPDRWPIEENV